MSIRNLNLRIKLGLVPIVFVALFLLSIMVIFVTQIYQKADAEVVNVAGRQRMLSQKIALMAERISRGQTELKKEYIATINLCDYSLKVLEKGGIAPKMTEIEIPEAPKSVETELIAAKELWELYQENAKSILVDNNQEYVRFLEENSNKMLAVFNNLVKAFVLHNSSKRDVQNIILATLLILNIVLAAVIYNLVNHNVSKPIIQISERLEELSEGKLGVPLVHFSSDEIGKAFSKLNALNEALTKITHFASAISKGEIKAEYELLSSDDKIGHSLIEMRDNIIQVLSQTNSVIDGVIRHGTLSRRVDMGDKGGVWRDLASSINRMLMTIATPMSEITGIFKKISEGDLTVSYDGRAVGELAELTHHLNNAINRLSSLIRSLDYQADNIAHSSDEMLHTGEEISRATSEIAIAVGEISSGAHLQMNDLDQSSALLSSIDASFESSSHNLNKIKELAMENEGMIKESSEEMSRIISLNDVILKVFEQSNQAITQLNDRNAQINKIAKVITEIASQTNLLAFNASIEAAHAGEQGRGFAVVADEIRKLAHDSQNSSREIETLLVSVREDISRTMEVFGEMSIQINHSVDAGNSAQKVILKMTDSVNDTTKYSDEVFKTMAGQSEIIKDLVSKSSSVVAVAEQSAAGTEQVASSSEEVSSAIKNYVQRFKELGVIAKSLNSQASRFNLKGREAVKG